MNHSCWLVDSTSIYIENLGEHLGQEGLNDYAVLKNVGQLIHKVSDWQRKTSDLLKINFLGDISLVSVILCLATLEIDNGIKDSIVAIVAVSCNMSQFFICCWMGSRIKIRIEKLSREL